MNTPTETLFYLSSLVKISGWLLLSLVTEPPCVSIVKSSDLC